MLSDLDEDLADPVIPAIAELVQTVTSARDTPAQDFSEKLGSDIEKAQSAALAMYAHSYPPSSRRILAALDLSALAGDGLAARIAACFDGAAMSPATAHRRLTELQAELESARATASQVASGLRKLGVTERPLEDENYELGVLVPSSERPPELRALSRELENWNKIVRAFQEAAGNQEREVSVRALSDGSVLVFLLVSKWVAEGLMTVVERLLAAYDKILDIRKKRKELADLGVPSIEVSQAKKTEKELLDSAISALVKETMKSASENITSDRISEVETNVQFSVKTIARFLDRGGQVEVSAPVLEEPDDEISVDGPDGAENASKSDVAKAKAALKAAQERYLDAQRIAARGAVMAVRGPIEHGVLQLEAPAEETDEKPTKKGKS